MDESEFLWCDLLEQKPKDRSFDKVRTGLGARVKPCKDGREFIKGEEKTRQEKMLGLEEDSGNQNTRKGNSFM